MVILKKKINYLAFHLFKKQLHWINMKQNKTFIAQNRNKSDTLLFPDGIPQGFNWK